MCRPVVPIFQICKLIRDSTHFYQQELKTLAPVSVLANFLQLVALGLIFFYLSEDLPPTWDRKLAADL